MVDINNIGPILKAKRREKNVKQGEIAEFVGCTQRQISNIERGVHKPSLSTFISYCIVLNETPNELLEIREKDFIIPELKCSLSQMSSDKQKQLLRLAEVL